MLASAHPELPAPLAVVCHDAGAANVIFAWLRAAVSTEPSQAAGWQVLAQGPAAHLWAERPVMLARWCDSIDEVLDGAIALLSGTGWASNLEQDARLAAQARGIETMAVIDHWVNYRERFTRHGHTALPDRILVTDEHAVREAQRCFPGLPVRQYANSYLQESVRSIRPLDERVKDVLYVLEPIGAERPGGQAGEFEALDYFASNLRHVVGEARCSLILRPHPSEAPCKYDDWIARHRELDASVDRSNTLAEAISRARWVVGAETFAMVVALAAGRKVISTLPPSARRCRLPYQEIAHLRDLVPPQTSPAE